MSNIEKLYLHLINNDRKSCNMESQWMRRRWLDFRNGHGLYLVFLMGFGNFILIFHRLLIERVEFLDNIFSNVGIFAVVFILIYIPAAIMIGHWHKKTQISVESEVILRQNPFFTKWIRIIVQLQLGQASKEEVKKLLEELESIEKGND